MKNFLRLIMLLLACVCSTMKALPPQYYAFCNLPTVAPNMCVRGIAQSGDGMMWFAAEDGLYSYDGYHLRKRDVAVEGHKLGKDWHVGSLNCIVSSGDSLVIGSDKGVISYNILSGYARRLDYACGEAVRLLEVADGRVLVATEKALYDQGRKVKGELNGIMGMKDAGDCLYVGTSDGAFRYIYNSRKVERLHTDRVFVTSIGGVEGRNLWYGTAFEVVNAECSAKTHKDLFAHNVPIAKVISSDSRGNVLVGTDNGMYVIDKEKNVSRVAHDARMHESLAGDVVWCIFRDKNDNMWIGTNNGVSVVRNNSALTVYSLPYITGAGDGNQIFCIGKDSQQRYWLGGSNGLICIEHLGEVQQRYRWYKMGSAEYAIPHNRVRAIYEDKNRRIWMGGDMGLCLYDEKTQQFVRCAIPNDANNWVYAIKDGGKGLLEVTTYSKTYLVSPDYSSFEIKVVKTSAKKPVEEVSASLDDMIRKSGMSEKCLSCFYDRKSSTILLGGLDKFAVYDDKAKKISEAECGVKVTDVMVNDNGYIDEQHIASASYSFSPEESVIRFYMSDFDYADLFTNDYVYKLSNGKDWASLEVSHPVVCSNLAPGTYTLLVKRSSDTKDEHVQKVFTFKIEAPWYDTTFAHICYLLLLLGVAYGTYRYVEQRKRLEAERKERAELLAKAKQKEKELLDENDYLSSQLRLQLVAQSGDDEELSGDEKFLLQVTRVIEGNMDDSELNVNTLSEKCGVSAKQLYRRIKAITGMTTVAYIRDQRLKKAASLLANGAFSVSEVMYMVGFTNPSYFSRCFAEEYGVAPSEYSSKK